MSKQELLWWVENLRLNNERSIRQKDPNLVIQTDASKSGWGVAKVQRGVNWGEMVRTGELTYKCSGSNSSQICDSNIHKRTIKYSNSLTDRQQDCTFISFENGGGGIHTTENSCTSASPFGVTFSATKLQCLQSTFPVL